MPSPPPHLCLIAIMRGWEQELLRAQPPPHLCLIAIMRGWEQELLRAQPPPHLCLIAIICGWEQELLRAQPPPSPVPHSHHAWVGTGASACPAPPTPVPHSHHAWVGTGASACPCGAVLGARRRGCDRQEGRRLGGPRGGLTPRPGLAPKQAGQQGMRTAGVSRHREYHPTPNAHSHNTHACACTDAHACTKQTPQEGQGCPSTPTPPTLRCMH